MLGLIELLKQCDIIKEEGDPDDKPKKGKKTEAEYEGLICLPDEDRANAQVLDT